MASPKVSPKILCLDVSNPVFFVEEVWSKCLLLKLKPKSTLIEKQLEGKYKRRGMVCGDRQGAAQAKGEPVVFFYKYK